MRNGTRMLAVLSAVVGLSAFAREAQAQNPHFVGDPRTRCSGSSLLISFKAAGLGQGEFVTASASDSAVVQCVNRGGNPPPGQEEDVSASGTFGPASKSGTISGTLVLEPTGSCPDHMTQIVTYSNITVYLDSSDSAFVSGPIVCSD